MHHVGDLDAGFVILRRGTSPTLRIGQIAKSLDRQRAEQHVAALRRWQEVSIAEFKHGMRRRQIVTLKGANHYVLLTTPSQVIQAMDRFIRRAVAR